ncbi:hypothetical protein [Streptomyces sp. NPDC047070]|uniref:hypothetical protein n=1 Tax=Streptomyces sp. NPDC047070 TaxID=3154923 RepID=UPI003453A675
MTANTRTGYRIERTPGQTLGRTHAGRFNLPLQLIEDGQQRVALDLVLTGPEAEQLHGELGRMLAGDAPAEPVGGAV